ncbi:MAG: hypothetical protein ACI4AH_05075 [Muribaculaceae bacterium]
MEFFAYLFLAIMIFVAISVLRFIFGVWRQARNIRKAFGKFADAANDADDEQPNRPERGKKFAKTDGEYVDFEEVADNGVEPAESADCDSTSDSYSQESQVSDAEYEEIK